MVTFTRSDGLREAQFVGTDLSGARFVGADLSGVVMRGVNVQGRTSTHRGSWKKAEAPCA